MKGRSLKFLGLGLGEIRPVKFSNIGGALYPAPRRGIGSGVAASERGRGALSPARVSSP